MNWNYRNFCGSITYSTDIGDFACIVEGANDAWTWGVYSSARTHHYGGTPESGGDTDTAEAGMAEATAYATTLTNITRKETTTP